MKKLFFLLATLTIVFSAANASLLEDDAVWSKPHLGNSYITNSKLATGDFRIWTEAYGAGAMAKVCVYFTDGSMLCSTSIGSATSTANHGTSKAGTANLVKLTAITNELGIIQPNSNAYGQCQRHRIH